MKKIISTVLCLLMLFACMNVSAKEPISVELDANILEFDVNPVNIDGRVLVPVRAIFEAIGATVSWDAPTKTVISKLDQKTVIMTIDKKTMTVNGEEIKLDVAPMIISDRTFVPVRATAEAYNANVLWDAENDMVRIVTKNHLNRLESIKVHTSSKNLNENTRSEFSISYFDDYNIKIDANDGTDFEILSESDKYFALLSVRADVYTGPEYPMTGAYAQSVADGMVKATFGTLISTEISHIDQEPFIKIHYKNPNFKGNLIDNTADVTVYMGIESGVVYTMTYITCGDVPYKILSDLNHIVNTLIIH